MIKIIANGKEKVFKQRCNNCATDFTYMLEDVKEYNYCSDKDIICPVCGESMTAYLMIEGEPPNFNPVYPI